MGRNRFLLVLMVVVAPPEYRKFEDQEEDESLTQF
jgi:hypothetical protein